MSGLDLRCYDEPLDCDAHRREGIVATRWWSIEDIETTSERVFPENLCGRLREWYRHSRVSQ
jgi:hypothetical protein